LGEESGGAVAHEASEGWFPVLVDVFWGVCEGEEEGGFFSFFLFLGFKGVCGIFHSAEGNGLRGGVFDESIIVVEEEWVFFAQGEAGHGGGWLWRFDASEVVRAVVAFV
jgi:hypothetical protein